jgi:dimethylargininase
MRTILRRFYPSLAEITAPATLDGGDICETGECFFLGVSHRTNHEGARQLAAVLDAPSAIIDIRAMTSILHLKSGISSIGDNTLVVIDELAGNELFHGYELIRVNARENYAANCVRVNDRVLIPAGYPLLTAELEARGFHPLPLDMSEFQKMDGGLSCLSLRF